jgi:GBP family porin
MQRTLFVVHLRFHNGSLLNLSQERMDMQGRIHRAVVGAVLVGVATAASAQVRLYGHVDAFFERVGTGGGNTLERISSGGAAVSRWGLRGSEDLGSGLKANYRLETGFNVDDGSVQTAGSAFGRWAHVGLSGPWGAIDAGRMWSPSFIIGLKADVLARNRTSLVTNLFRGSGTAAATGAALPGFLGNSLRYTTPDVQGFTAEAMATFGESGTTSSAGDGVGVNLQYTNGPLFMGYGYQALKAAVAALPARSTTETTHILGASYAFSAVTLYGAYNRNRSDVAGRRSSRNLQASVAWKLAGPHTVLAQVATGRVDDAPARARGWQVGYDLELSKRTKVYARHGRINNQGGAAIAWSGAALTVANGDPGFTGVGVSHAF